MTQRSTQLEALPLGAVGLLARLARDGAQVPLLRALGWGTAAVVRRYVNLLAREGFITVDGVDDLEEVKAAGLSARFVSRHSAAMLTIRLNDARVLESPVSPRRRAERERWRLKKRRQRQSVSPSVSPESGQNLRERRRDPPPEQ